MNLFIFGNPMSGSFSGQQQINHIVEVCTEKGIPFKLFQTQRAGELPELMDKHLQQRNQHTIVVIVGGDGTLNEALQYLKQQNIFVPLSYLPAGTGNDFSREMNLTHHARKFIENLSKNHIIDLEFLTYSEENSQKTGIILNSMGFGIDAAICEINQKQRQALLQAKGIKKASYLTPIIKAFKERKEFDALITLNDGESFTSTKNLLLGAFNHAYFGGGIRFVPSATQGSHHFQIAIARKVSLFTVLKAFPFILTNGTHFKLFPKNLKEYSCTKANIKINEPIKAQKDGEFVTYPTVNLNLSMDHYPFLLTNEI